MARPRRGKRLRSSRAARYGLPIWMAALAACSGGGSAGTSGGTPPPGDGGALPPAPGNGGARVVGTVTDSGALGAGRSGAPAGGVTVEVHNARGKAIGSATTDTAGRFSITGLATGAAELKISLPASASALAGGPAPTLGLAVTLADRTDATLVEDLGAADLDGDGQSDAVVFAGYVRDVNGERVHLMALDPRAGRTTPDTNGDGRVTRDDASFVDSNEDGVPDDSQQGVPVTSEVHARGVIDSIDASSITVGGVTFTVDASTVWLDRNGAATVPSAFGAGEPVEVEGVRQSDGSVVATRVKQEDDAGGVGEHEIELTGTIEALDGATITVRGVTFAVTADTAVTGSSNQPLAFADLAVGDFVEVKGEDAGSGVVAVRIHLEDLGDDAGGEVELRGAIDAIGPDSITVGGQVFLTNGATAYRGDHGTTLDRSDLAVGDVVEIEGTRDANGNLVASKVKLEDESGDGHHGGGSDDGSGDDHGGGGGGGSGDGGDDDGGGSGGG